MAQDVDRRSFLGWLAGASLGATALLSGGTIAKAVTPPERSIDGKTKMGPLAVARLSDLRQGEPLLVEYGDDVLFLVLAEDGTVSGLDAACPHVACKLHFNQSTREFDCPCHASSFALDGTVLGGPAPRDMYAARLEVVGDEVVVSGFDRA
ncbi:MAG: Rieske 2Fe-2S domain-containing protein [Coriobacteriia bacterium]|nr:Rieske 2Fe-2S domain-containing protein [Coriobacteriia bacterium]